jgi:murein DD-endopeptidase MepM/ murein hydrolase activator NlpD
MPGEANTRNKIITYVVRDGDTLSGIAAKFNITTATIRYANKLEDENSVKPGQTLTILPITGLIHTVSAGDTLAGIAARYKANQEMIISQNDLYGEEIVAGMQLLIPDGEIPDAPKPVAAPVTTNNDDNSSSGGGSYSNSSTRYGSGNFRFPTIVGSMGYYNGYHYWAIDIPNSIGTPIFAADSGRIVEAQYGYNGGYGNTILIDHGNGFQTRYAHMSSLAVIGGYVSKGQVIGFMGSTGRSTGSHLHFEIILNGSRQNPMNYF